MTLISIKRTRRALTLVEMLVGMAITLVMMAAVVNLFANISEGVRNRRATMEVAANLRIARTRLFNDLAGATCLKYPKDAFGVMPQPDVNNPPDGYFEIVEGRWSDDNPPLLPASERATSLLPSSNILYNDKGEPINPNEITDGGGRGDYDDILAMTVESESERFRGRGRGLRPGGDPTVLTDWVDMTISSPVAEVVWFAVQTPLRTDPSYTPDMGEPGMRKVYRRVLLVAPWYGTATVTTSGSPVTGSDDGYLDLVANGFTTYAQQIGALRDFQEKYDLSVRLENGRIVPNTLADLSRRENRFAHAPNDSITPASAFPHQFPYDVTAPVNYVQPQYDPDPDDPDTNVGSLRRLGDERQNEDLVLDNVLAFDVQVFDPGAPLFLAGYSGTAANPVGGATVQPSGTTGSAFLAAVAGGAPITGFGTYVDLGWNNGPNDIPDYIPGTNAPLTLFQQERRVGWHPLDSVMYSSNSPFRGTPAVYDTWSTYYESDRVNQDNLLYSSNAAAWQTDIIDQGTNGLDENNINGPDDPLERETSPPYPYPLRGVQVKLRIYEPESRQIRETTVTRNLVK